MGGLIVIIGMLGSAITILLVLLKLGGVLHWPWAGVGLSFLVDVVAVIALMSLGIFLESNSRAAIFVAGLFRRARASSAASSGSWG
jgi:hypothetical protein